MIAGRITVSKVEGGGYSVDFEAADAQWEANTHPTQGRDATKEPEHHSKRGPSTQNAAEQKAETAVANVTAAKFSLGRAAKMAYEAATAELNYKARVGELVERAKEESRARSLAQEVKDAMLGIPDRLSALLAAESDPLRVHIMLTDELISALDRLSTAEGT